MVVQEKNVITETFKLALIIGLPAEQFWSMTPWQFKCCIDAYITRREFDHNRAVWVMWHGAALTKMQKKMPPLKEFMAGQKKQQESIDEDMIKSQLKAYQKRFENGNSSQA